MSAQEDPTEQDIWHSRTPQAVLAHRLYFSILLPGKHLVAALLSAWAPVLQHPGKSQLRCQAQEGLGSAQESKTYDVSKSGRPYPSCLAPSLPQHAARFFDCTPSSCICNTMCTHASQWLSWHPLSKPLLNSHPDRQADIGLPARVATGTLIALHTSCLHISQCTQRQI